MLFLFRTDFSGKLLAIAFDNQIRSGFDKDLTPEDVQKMYTALKKFSEILNSKDNRISYMLKPGRFHFLFKYILQQLSLFL